MLQKEEKYKRTIKTFVMRSRRMTDLQKRKYNELYAKWCIPFGLEKICFRHIFNNDNPVVIEIGFGMGLATAQIAKENPEINYIGIEVFKAGIGKLLGEIENLHLLNLRIIEYDALEVLENMIEDESLSGFHIFFPDPWQKKRNHKRRLVHRPNTDLLAAKLVDKGYIYMATDWEDYAEDAFIHLSDTPTLKSKYEKFAVRQEWRPVTKFEKKGIEKNHKINELFFCKFCN